MNIVRVRISQPKRTLGELRRDFVNHACAIGAPAGCRAVNIALRIFDQVAERIHSVGAIGLRAKLVDRGFLTRRRDAIDRAGRAMPDILPPIGSGAEEAAAKRVDEHASIGAGAIGALEIDLAKLAGRMNPLEKTTLSLRSAFAERPVEVTGSIHGDAGKGRRCVRQAKIVKHGLDPAIGAGRKFKNNTGAQSLWRCTALEGGAVEISRFVECQAAHRQEAVEAKTPSKIRTEVVNDGFSPARSARRKLKSNTGIRCPSSESRSVEVSGSIEHNAAIGRHAIKANTVRVVRAEVVENGLSPCAALLGRRGKLKHHTVGADAKPPASSIRGGSVKIARCVHDQRIFWPRSIRALHIA